MKRERATGRAATFLACGILLLVACVAAPAQTGTSSVRGTVADAQGNVVAGAAVTITNQEKSFTRTQTTNQDGGYAFTAVPPGTYRVDVEAKGFKKTSLTNVAARVDTPTSADVQLQVGDVSETVSITAGAEAPINTTDATIGNAFNESQIRQLPLEARNVAGLLSLQPGVTFIGNVDQTGGTTDYRNGAVNGGKSDQANVMLDGIDVNDQQTGQAFNSVLRVTLDSVQEFRVVTTNPNAEQGRSSGAQVSLVTKSGTNQFHGSLYESHRNTVTSANSFFNNAVGSFGPNDLAVRLGQARVGDPRAPRPKLLRNVFGGSFGGPLRRDKAFFFFNYEGRRDAREESVVRTVPTASLRQGFFTFNNTSGGVTVMTPAQVTALDPLHLGPDPAVLAVFNQYPLPNDTTVGDLQNTAGFRFNSPIHLRWNTYIARFDYNLNQKNTLFWRGNLQNDKDNSTQQFPGQPARFVNLNNSKGFAAGYTSTVTQNLVNVLRAGFTRQGIETIGNSPLANQPIVSFRTFSDLFPVTRSGTSIIPVWNVLDDLTWTKGPHSMQFGTNIRWIRNSRLSFANSFHSAITNRSWLLSQSPIRPQGLASSSQLHAMVALLGIVSQVTASYNTGRVGGGLGPLAQGDPTRFRYGVDEYEWYAQDSWRVRPNLTLTYGLRYSLYSPPWETTGLQVAPSVPLGEWFEQRGRAMLQGIPNEQAVPDITFGLAGPKNGRVGFYDWDKNNFAPRLAFAYSPGFKGGFMKWLAGGAGRASIRGGYSLVYDRVGGNIVLSGESTSTLNFGLNTRLTNAAGSQTVQSAPRFSGLTNIPAALLPPNVCTGLPCTFPTDPTNGFAITSGIDNTIRTPYSQTINLSFSRELPAKLTFEAAYVGRLGRHILINTDAAMPLDLVDPASGMDYFTAASILARQALAGVPVANVQPVAYWENLWPGLSGRNNRTATQNIYSQYLSNSPDFTTALFNIDVNCVAANRCSRFGPNALFDDQFSSMAVLRDLMSTNYHAMQLLLRRRFANGAQFDVNYTYGKSFDWASRLQRDSFFLTSASTINAWNPHLRKAVSDYDMTHQLNVNGIWELPVGRGRTFLRGARGPAEALLGGWQLSGIWRWTSGLPTSIGNGLNFPTNWELAGHATQVGNPGQVGVFRNVEITPGQGGTPNIFADPNAAFNAFQYTLPGQVGSRNVLRGDGYFSIDMGLAKSWAMPWSEGQKLQFRWEVFNVTNSVRFDPSNTISTLDDPNIFGKYTDTLTQPRVMQFGLRFTF